MKKNRWVLRMLALLALSGILMTTATLAAEAGSSGDPLVTLSYLNGTFLESILQRVDQKIAEHTGQAPPQTTVSGGSSSAVSFHVVTLSNGQVLTGEVGCEVMLRIGSASCVASGEPGLVDETTAGTLNNGGTLVTNHLYMMTIDGRGVQATAATTKLMVRGGYIIS